MPIPQRRLVLTHCGPYAERRVAIVKATSFCDSGLFDHLASSAERGCACADRGLEISPRRAAEKEAAAFAVHKNKAGFERDAANLTLYQRGTFSEHFRIRLVRRRPRIAGTEQRRGNAGGKQLDPNRGGVPDMADVVPPRRRLQPALDEAVYLPVIQFADDVSRRGLKDFELCRLRRSPVRGPTTSRPLSVSSCGRSRRISAGYLSRPSLSRAKPLKQLLAIMLVFTSAIVLTFGRGMAPRCAVA